jgi:hypothetical protein
MSNDAPIPDAVTLAGATALAVQLTRYWAQRGYDIRAWVELAETKAAHGNSVHCVKSTLINGLPPGYPTNNR